MDQASRSYGEGHLRVDALNNVSLQVRPGEMVAVMGPSGSGKSTLLRLAGGLDALSSGEVRIHGQRISQRTPGQLAAIRRRHIGFVFHELNLVSGFSALENVMLPLELDGQSVRAAKRQALAALEEVGLADEQRRFPDQLSGGQQQRVAIARALVGSRDIVLADEPTGALDTYTGESIMRLLRERVDAGAACIAVTHDSRFAAWSDRVIFLRDGKVIDSSASQIESDARDLF